MVADLAADKSGVHMSRFAEILEEATLDVLARDTRPARVERLTEAIAREIVTTPARGPGRRAVARRVRVGALDSGERQARRRDVHARRHRARRRGWYATRRRRRSGRNDRLSVRAGDGARARAARTAGRRLQRRADATRALDALPVATHNQRGRGAILLGVDEAQRGGDSRRGSGRDRRKLDVERDLRSAEAARRVLRRQQSPPQSEVRRGRGAGNPGARARRVRGPRRRNVRLREPSQRGVDPQARRLRGRLRALRRVARGTAQRLTLRRRPILPAGCTPVLHRCSRKVVPSSASIRARSDGCEEKKSSYQAGGSSSARF